jgi:hypothetical protein
MRDRLEFYRDEYGSSQAIQYICRLFCYEPYNFIYKIFDHLMPLLSVKNGPEMNL